MFLHSFFKFMCLICLIHWQLLAPDFTHKFPAIIILSIFISVIKRIYEFTHPIILKKQSLTMLLFFNYDFQLEAGNCVKFHFFNNIHITRLCFFNSAWSSRSKLLHASSSHCRWRIHRRLLRKYILCDRLFGHFMLWW